MVLWARTGPAKKKMELALDIAEKKWWQYCLTSTALDTVRAQISSSGRVGFNVPPNTL